ncbi:sulfatase [Nitzschia inconspicua]|uniref:Sulfatase n=1 Tax=Nitzschia inconspicua TaxID=303405 RepID=A0A9K3LAT6_9STRA|nr:sulfatase [Nitzschia inconspicua]KAG7358667.1 sulfatase [Nitzschia inconspicua]
MAPLDYLAFEPVVLQFSLFAAKVTEDTYPVYLPDVMDPLFRHVLCRNEFFVTTPENDTDPIMPSCASYDYHYFEEDLEDFAFNSSATTSDSTTLRPSIFNRKPPDDPNLTVLRPASILVVDRHASNLTWTSWNLYFDLEQLGKSIQDMAYVGSGVGEKELDDNNVTISLTTTFISSVETVDRHGIQIHFESQQQIDNIQVDDDTLSTFSNPMTEDMMYSAVTNVLQLALDVNIMEGTLDGTLQQYMRRAKFSCPGDELVTFGAESEMNGTLQQRNDTILTDSDKISPSSMSMVAMSMYNSNTLRNCGAVMLISTLLLLWSLIEAAKRQKYQTEKETTEEEMIIPQEVIFTPITIKLSKKSRKKPKRMAPIVILALLLPLTTVTCTDMPPNFVIILTDDLDWTLGGANASTLSRTRKYIAEEGKTFANWFVQTPVCCPSRAELLTGKLYHNLRYKEDIQPSCMHVNVTDHPEHPFYSRDYFGPYFSRNKTLKYNVGVFGKHLNSQNPSNFMLPGVDEMLINDGGSYLNPMFTYGSGTDKSVQNIHFNNCKNYTGMPCYSTSILGNVSLSWIERQVKEAPRLRPFMALVSVKAPHVQDANGYSMSIPAPWYTDTPIKESIAPRTPNYNYSGFPDHHWLVRSQGPLTDEEGEKIDELYVSRLKTLISVDDLVEELVLKLDAWGVLNNTYVIFTSDNGYRLGQFRMSICKLHPYENDIRVPMMIRGPGISKNSTTSLVSTHVNLMPTLMGLATKQYDSQDIVPPTMDGMNLAGKILDHVADEREKSLSTFEASSVLVEYTTLGNVVRFNHLVDTFNHSFVALRIVDTDPAHYPFHNMKYVEFRDTRIDWNMTEAPLERELYDLDHDPFEMHNLVTQVSPVFVEALSKKIQKMIQCQGASCRQEHSFGLDGYWSAQMATDSLIDSNTGDVEVLFSKK